METLKNVKCNLCGKDDFKVIYDQADAALRKKAGEDFSCSNDGHGEHYRVVRCNNCGLYYSSPRPDIGSLESEYFAIEDERYKDEMEGRRRLFKRNLKNLSKVKIPPGKMLEIGCALGIFLKEAKNIGWDVKGIDPSKWYVDKAKELFNVDALCGTCKDLKAINEKFDVVAMWDVLEHVDDPLEAIMNCKNALKDDGVFVFSTVDIGSFYARILGRKWPWLMKMHIYYFDKRTIREYLKKVGLELIKLRKYKHIVSFDYLLYKLQRINPALFKFLNFIKRYVLFNRNFYVTVCMGDFIEVYARKV